MYDGASKGAVAYLELAKEIICKNQLVKAKGEAHG
jgi:hypothetical protein